MKEQFSAVAPSAPATRSAATHVRYRVLAFAVAAYMITYIDRMCISNAVPSIQKEFGFSIVTMGWILSSFQWGYAIFQIPSAWIGDKVGPRRALAGIVALWSMFTCSITLAWNAVSMAAIQFLFGSCESGAFPITTSSLSRWILPAERGTAQGLTHAGARLGGAIAPFLVVMIIVRWGWRAAFISCASLGVIWATAWFWFYRNTPAEHKSVNPAELELIHSSLERDGRGLAMQIPWKKILHSPQVWILSGMYFCYAYNLAVYLTWFPTYLNANRGFDLEHMGMYSSLVLMAGMVGDIAGGSLSDVLARRSGNIKLARRTVGTTGFLLSAICMVPASLTSHPYTCLWFSCAAIFGLEMTVGVSWAITLDIGDHFAGSVSSVMNTCGNIGGATASTVSAYLVMLYGWDAPFLLMAAISAVGALLYLRIHAGMRIRAGSI